MDNKKKETTKRKVVQVKPKQKKNTVDFSKFFNFLSFVIPTDIFTSPPKPSFEVDVIT